MDAARTLELLGLQMPGPAYLFGAIVFGLVGMAAFRAGRRSGRRTPLWLGLALMVYPYAVMSTWLLYAVGAACCVGLWLDHRAAGA